MSENSPAGQTGPIICGSAFIVGALCSAAWLNDQATTAAAQSILRFGNWISGFAGIQGFWPALLVSSLMAGLICFCLAAAILPKLEEWVASRGAERAKRALLKEGKLSIEDEMKALVRKFGRKKPE